MQISRKMTPIAIALALAAGPALAHGAAANNGAAANKGAAANNTVQSSTTNQPKVKIADWSYQPMEEAGISVEALLDAEVYGSDGEEMGEVENLVVSGDTDRVTGLVIETGGFLDFGDTHLVYPFDQAKIQSVDHVDVSIDGDNVEDFSLFSADGVEGVPIPGQKWRITDLIGDTAYADGQGIGWIDDVAISKSGKILGVIVQPDVTYDDSAYYAWPFLGYDPALGYYNVPYDANAMFDLNPFNYDGWAGI